jgi:hypothetical protein
MAARRALSARLARSLPRPCSDRVRSAGTQAEGPGNHMLPLLRSVRGWGDDELPGRLLSWRGRFTPPSVVRGRGASATYGLPLVRPAVSCEMRRSHPRRRQAAAARLLLQACGQPKRQPAAGFSGGDEAAVTGRAIPPASVAQRPVARFGSSRAGLLNCRAASRCHARDESGGGSPKRR